MTTISVLGSLVRVDGEAAGLSRTVQLEMSEVGVSV